jgi:hypothetical protein
VLHAHGTHQNVRTGFKAAWQLFSAARQTYLRWLYSPPTPPCRS